MPAEPTYVYSEIDGQYLDVTTLAPVPEHRLRDAIEAAIAALALLVAGLATRLRDGDLTLAEWELQMIEALRTAHLAVGAAAYGGLQELSPARLGVLEGLIATQLQYLDAWARDIATGGAPVGGQALLVRAGLYAQAPRGTFGDVATRQAELRGARWERNVRDSRDACRGCLAATAAGWVALRTLPPIGQRDCLANCRCHLEFRTEAEHTAAQGAA